MKIFSSICLYSFVLSVGSCSKVSSQHCDNFKSLSAGSRLECIQGVFSPTNTNNPEISTFEIINGFKFLTVAIQYSDASEIILGYVGFNDFDGYPTNKYGEIKTESFYLCDLKQNGKYHITILEKDLDSNLKTRDMFIQKEFSCDAGTIEEFNRSLTIHEKIDFLPFRAYEQIKKYSKKNKRDLVQEFSLIKQLQRAEIKVDRAHFHSEPDQKTIRKGFVVRGDVVIVDQLQREWIKVAFEGEQATSVGWVRRSELELINN